jgi:hypothetical protein
VSVYGWQTLPGDQTTLAELANGGVPLPSYNVRAMQTEKEHPLYGEAG